MRGKTRSEVREELEASGMEAEQIVDLLPHKIFPGQPAQQHPADRQDHAAAAVVRWSPSMSTRSLCQGVIWRVNSFDQLGRGTGQTAWPGVILNAAAG